MFVATFTFMAVVLFGSYLPYIIILTSSNFLHKWVGVLIIGKAYIREFSVFLWIKIVFRQILFGFIFLKSQIKWPESEIMCSHHDRKHCNIHNRFKNAIFLLNVLHFWCLFEDTFLVFYVFVGDRRSLLLDNFKLMYAFCIMFWKTLLEKKNWSDRKMICRGM